MATSTCVKCGSGSFEIKAGVELKNGLIPVNFVQCAHCGGVVGVLDQQSPAYLIKELAKRLRVPLE